MKVLITGGAGFIGSHVVEECKARGIDCVVLDNLSTGKKENIPSGIKLINGDLLQLNLDQVIQDEKITAICHLAAKVSVRQSALSFVEDAETNFVGTLKLARASKQNNLKTFVLASSMAVYADSKDPFPIDETHPTQPLSPYGVAKLAAERDLMLIFDQTPCRSVALRYFNTFGPRQTPSPYVGVVTIFNNALSRGEGIQIYGSGNQTRDFIYVRDIARSTTNALLMPKVRGVFNLGTGQGTTVNAIASQLLAHHQAKPNLATYLPKHHTEIENSIADISKAREVLDHKVTKTISEYIDEMMI